MISKVLIGIILGGGIIGYLYYTNTQAELTELREYNMAMELQVKTQNETIDKMSKQYEQQAKALGELTSKNAEIEAEMTRYLDIFRRHNLSKLAAAKPGLIEPRVNNATKEVFDSLESDSAFEFDTNN
ncbi:MAG: hypothetical protein CL515_03275 [Actinobacteria bacterium]|nr:hypothetical protein [Actinomycetota bacterium]|tara:strand:- start:13644 stop:14027 length:384 start_codon:yes stop_codon:yes gene_type:complete